MLYEIYSFKEICQIKYFAKFLDFFGQLKKPGLKENRPSPSKYVLAGAVDFNPFFQDRRTKMKSTFRVEKYFKLS